MKVEVLVSCMNQRDRELVAKSRITTDVLIINQASEEKAEEYFENGRRVRMLTTRERGLSRSRNMALKYAQGDICVLCDDDEIFANNYKGKILKSFEKVRDADIIAFDVVNKETRLSRRVQKIGYLKSLRISSCQIAFRRESILKRGLSFDVYMGAGSGNGCGEENKFLIDALKNGLKIYYVPTQIAKLDGQDSTWFAGFDQNFFYQRGAATRYMLGYFPAVLYGIYYILVKRKMYRSSISAQEAWKELFAGIQDNAILHQKTEAEQQG